MSFLLELFGLYVLLPTSHPSVMGPFLMLENHSKFLLQSFVKYWYISRLTVKMWICETELTCTILS